MIITEINPKSVKKINDRELLNMHRRCHQLYTIFKRNQNSQKNKQIELKHEILANEILRRKMKHNSPLKTIHEHSIEDYI